jgi:hypothetical protein
MPISDHGRDHFVAGCSVVLEVGEPRSQHGHIDLDVPPYVTERAVPAIIRDGAAASRSCLRTIPIVWHNRRIGMDGFHRCVLG